MISPATPKPVYDAAGIQIYHGDSRQIAPLLPHFDLLCTDPPYGIKVAPKGVIGGSRHKRSTRHKAVTWDGAPPAPWTLQMLVAKASRAILFGGNYFEALGPSACWLVWDKRNDGMSFANAELAWTNLPGAVRMFRWRWNGCLQEDMANKETRVHPTQKPVPVMRWCIGRAKGVRTILDPYMGSGSTLVAAKQLGLRAVGIERDADYIASAIARLDATTAVSATLPEPLSETPKSPGSSGTSPTTRRRARTP